MLNIHDLEKRWKIYKIKSLLPYIIIGITLLIILPVIYNFYTNSNKNTPPKKQIIKKTKITATVIQPQKKVKVEPKVIPIHKKPVNSQTSIENQKLHPSMNFMKNIQYEASQSEYVEQHTIKKQPPVNKRRKVVQQKLPKENIEDITTEVIPVKKEPKVTITIERKETQNDIFEVIKRFKKNNNPALSLFVAKKYYELGNYKESYNYALITNQINPNIEASWLVFAKSLAKLHEKDKAIRTLQAYIKVSHSSNAEVLLNEIISGKFK